MVILIIGILAAIAIPAFLNQKGKADDASAKEPARTAETTAETYSTDHEGGYTGMSLGELEKYETGLTSAQHEQRMSAQSRRYLYHLYGRNGSREHRRQVLDRTKRDRGNRPQM